MKIICVGKNYREHAKEMGDGTPKEPLLFMKPSTALLIDNKSFYIPDFSEEIHYECEWVVRICKKGRHIDKAFVHRYIDQMGVGIDFTARDLQKKLKAAGHPWEKAKAFDHSAAISSFVEIEASHRKEGVAFDLTKNGQIVQSGHTAEMIHPIEELVSYISRFFTLQLGDYIYTGTPAGVGPVKRGDVLKARMEGKLMLTCEIK